MSEQMRDASTSGSNTGSKPVPNEPAPMPAMDHTRTRDANLAPQGEMHIDEAPQDSSFTPEGDQEPAPNIPPSATDPE